LYDRIDQGSRASACASAGEIMEGTVLVIP